MKVIARIFSVVFQPIFIPIIGIILLLIDSPTLHLLKFSSKLYIVGVVFLTTTFVPAVTVAIGMIQGKIKDEFISNRRERTTPYLISLIGYIGCIVWLRLVGLHTLYLAPIIGSAISIVLLVLINFRWKISAHLCSMGGLVGGTFAYAMIFRPFPPYTLIVSSILISGIVGWSRMLLKAHTLGQVCCGWTLGFITISTTWLITNAII